MTRAAHTAEPVLRNCLVSLDRLRADVASVRRRYRKHGIVGAGRAAASIASVYGRQVLLSTVERPSRSFALGGVTLPYLWHWHVTTFLNERAVELPIVVHQLQRTRPTRLLEVGNVLNYYLRRPHVVVDKYEVAPDVINEDVVEFRAAEPFDMIVSISTIEHVGWDETPKDPSKTITAIAHLRSLLAPGGRLVCTMPLGYNPHLDAHLAAGRLPFDEVRYLRRLNARNEWREAAPTEVRGAQYGSPYMHANALAVGFASGPCE